MDSVKVEIFIRNNHKVSSSELRKVFGPEVTKCLALIILTNNFRIEHTHGKVFITCEDAVNKTKFEKKIVRKQTKSEDTVKPKMLPIDGDWVVTSTDSNDRLYFDSKYSRDDVRLSFRKNTGVNFHNTRAKRYKKIEPVKVMGL